MSLDDDVSSSLERPTFIGPQTLATPPLRVPGHLQPRPPIQLGDEVLEGSKGTTTHIDNLLLETLHHSHSDISSKAQRQDASPIIAQARKKTASKYKKAPDAPKRFKSAFIFFSANKHKEIRSQMGAQGLTERTSNVAKLISEAWKKLGPQEKVKWETMAVADRRRYDTEKTLYQGPWHVPRNRKAKDADAPKRPMSSFLAFANSRRSIVKQDMPPDTSTGEVSKTLATMWREAPNEVRQHYIREERVRRREYNAVMADWKRKDQTKKHDEQNQRVKLALRLIASSAGNLQAGGAATAPLAYTNPSADLFSDEDLAFTMNIGAVPYANPWARAPPSDRHSYHHAGSAHYYLHHPSLDAHQASLASLFYPGFVDSIPGSNGVMTTPASSHQGGSSNQIITTTTCLDPFAAAACMSNMGVKSSASLQHSLVVLPLPSHSEPLIWGVNPKIPSSQQDYLPPAANIVSSSAYSQAGTYDPYAPRAIAPFGQSTITHSQYFYKVAVSPETPGQTEDPLV